MDKYYVAFFSDGTVKQCNIAGIHPVILGDAESVTKEDFDKYCTRQYRKNADGQPERIEPVESLDDAKVVQWATIKAERDRLEMSGVAYLGAVFDSDALSVQRIGIAVQAAQAAKSAGQPFSVDWTTADNTVVTLTAEEVIGLPLALAAYSNSLHVTARELRDQIEAAATVDEVKAIVWPT